MATRPLLSPAEGSALYDTLFDAGASLGSGAFGTVRCAVRRTDGAAVALKLLTPSSPARAAAARAEAATLMSLVHEHVVRCYDALPLLPDAVLGPGALPRLCLVLELCETDLAHLIASGALAGAPRTALQHALGVTSGLRYLHSRGVAHRDVKPQNVFVRRGMVKLGDLGSAVETESNVGTQGYRAPELAAGASGCDAFRADRWALGVTLAELGCGCGELRPQHGDLAYSTRAARHALAAQVDAACPPLAPLVRRLLRRAPGRRLRLGAAVRLLSAMADAAEAEDSRSEGQSSEDDADTGAYTTPDEVSNTRLLLQHPDAETRRAMALYVGAMGSSAFAIMYLNELVHLLSDAVPSVRMAAAVALCQVGPSATRACPRLVQLLGSVDEAVSLREAAAVALGAIDDVAARAVERTDRQPREHIAPVIDALVCACADAAVPDVVRLAAMNALRRVVQGAWRLSSSHADALRPLVLQQWLPGEAPPAGDVVRCARDVLWPLFIEAVHERGGCCTWPLERSTRSPLLDADYGRLRI